ncbi:MAG TPA: GDSL-type esterase/lipase family protein [Patescibacteria group bacterium]|nr:GDSL-type esterase/lipase family protein [Patescibacteria group bacterium]
MRRPSRLRLVSVKKMMFFLAIPLFSLLFLLIFMLFLGEYLGLGFVHYKPHLEMTQEANQQTLSWPRLPYPAYYEVDVLTETPENDTTKSARSQIVARYRTLDNHLTVDKKFPFRTYWRVSAKSFLQQKLGRFSDPLVITPMTEPSQSALLQFKPQPTSFFNVANPAPRNPMLTWTPVPGAVYYEFELLDAPPENLNDTEPSRHQIFSSREVFTNGYNLLLSPLLQDSSLYWRARALDKEGNPLGVFSDAERLYWNSDNNPPVRPLINATYNQPGTADLLYPVYSWIPVTGAVSYEVELCSQPPENPYDIQPSQFRIWSQAITGLTDCYDENPRSQPGIYYWRVRGLDPQGQPVGVYSDACSYTVDLTKGQYAATFGDSITHGGGAISYSPADWEYSFQTYLNFPTVNLGKSGDTSETMLERFRQDVLPYHPRFLLIMGGSNSLRGGASSRQVIHNLTAIRDLCTSNGIRPIFLTLPPINPKAIAEVFQEETVPYWRDEFAQVNRFIRQQRYFIDLEPYFVDSEGELPLRFAIDGLHLDIAGKKLMAEIINRHWPMVTR